MGYGRGEYGQAGFGGSSFEAGGPVLVSSDPLNGAVGVLPTAPITFHIQSPAGLDEFSLNVDVDGQQAIVGGIFQPSFSGTIDQNPETDMVVTIATHPAIPGGPTPIDIFVEDLAGNSANLNFTYDTLNAVIVAEAVTFSEALTTQVDFNVLVAETVAVTEDLTVAKGYTVTVDDTVSFFESLETGSLQVIALDASTFRVQLPIELRFDGIRDLHNYHLSPASPGAAGAHLVSIEPGYQVKQTGNSFYALPSDFAYTTHPNPLLQGSAAEGLTNILDANFTAVMTPDHIGDYIEVQNGESLGRYQIIGLDFLNLGGPDPRARIIIDDLLPLRDSKNGYVDGLATIISFGGGLLTLELDHPLVTPSDALIEIMLIENRTTGLQLELSFFLVNPSFLVFQTHKRFQVTTATIFFPVQANDRIYVLARVTPKLQWRHTGGVKEMVFRTNRSPGTKLTLNETYAFEAHNLFTKETRAPFNVETLFTVTPPPSQEQKPKVIAIDYQAEDGTIIVEFDQEMRVDDANLGNIGDYTITGPTAVQVKKVFGVSPTKVALHTAGMGAGEYTLEVSTSTPKDVAGNPIDPLFNTVIFTAAIPETVRSVFTDRGPIAKPPLTLQTGSGGTLQTHNEVLLTGASLSVTNIGHYVRLTGGTLNGGTFRIASVLSATRARLANASFTLPDPDSGTLSWELFDPRHGQIADDPADVVVRINNVPVAATAVVGLLGQVVLNTSPAPADDVKIDYSWVCNPTVEVRRLNSREFRLNAWNRDVGYLRDKSQHKYRYNNVLIRPEDYDPEIPSAVLDQPVLRELHYRAYERAYTPVLNDPTLLLLNSPIHRIAYPPSERILSEQFVAYEGIGLPESLIVDPWTKKGSGIATSSVGRLTVTDNTTGPYPGGDPLFWTRPIDVTFQHVFAMSWRFSLDTVATYDGVFSGVAAGYSDDKVVLVIGYLLDGSQKIGILKRGFGNDPSSAAAWTGGVAPITGASTGLPADFNWDTIHSYRIYRDINGTIRVYVDGEIVEILRVSPDELPFLEELEGPFNQIQGTFFGSLSRPAENTSTWDFVRYLIQPTNPKQASASSFVSYEANVVPEQDSKPWTPVGFHGTETIQSSDYLLLDSTSATDSTTAEAVGYVGGDFKGFVRFEPLLTQSSELVLDAQLQLLTHTHGVSPYGLVMAVDDGQRLMQVAFFPDKSTPKISYGGRSFPEDFAPFSWQTAGGATVDMAGRYLHIEDTSILDGRVYFHDDTSPLVSDDRVLSASFDYMLECRCRMVSFTPDGAGYAGAFAQVYDSTRLVGLMLEEIAGTTYVTFHSDGTPHAPAGRFAFNWDDGEFHTYRLVKSTTGNLVSLFIDGTFTGSLAYSTFSAPVPDPIGQVSFGSSTPASSGALSVVEWAYTNTWRVRNDQRRYVGIWRGHDADSLLGYHLPLKTSGKNAQVAANALVDLTGNFIALGVVVGDLLVVDAGPNIGVYTISSVINAVSLMLSSAWPSQPSQVDYRIVKETDWTAIHKYRLFRDATGEVSLLLDGDPDPLIRIGYNSLDLPESGVGLIQKLGNGLPTVAFGSFDAENLEQSRWDFVRYGLTRSVTELRIAPHHQIINQWNVMESPERLFTILPHELTDFKSSSTGNVPKKDPDFLADPGLPAFTLLNENTPLVPRTQTFEVRAPFPVQEFVSALNQPEDVLNNDGDFTTNDGTKRFRLIVPKDVLYSSLDVIEHSTGENDLLAPFDDECQPNFGGFQYQKEVCLEYDGAILPENDIAAPTPWKLVSDNPAEVNAAAFAGILTYGTGATGTKTVYRNDTPLPDHPSLINEVKFRLKLLNDASGGIGETQVMFGFSAPGMTAALTFVTTPLGERYVLVLDLNNGGVLGAATFDFLDGNYHTYRLIRDPGRNLVQVFIDS